jgi:hypothetical protein
MHFDTRISNARIVRNAKRPGFQEPYHQVVFTIESDGINPIEIGVWVHPSYPDDEILKVGRTFLAGRLRDMATVAASEKAYTPSEVDALWQRVKPESGL